VSEEASFPVVEQGEPPGESVSLGSSRVETGFRAYGTGAPSNRHCVLPAERTSGPSRSWVTAGSLVRAVEGLAAPDRTPPVVPYITSRDPNRDVRPTVVKGSRVGKGLEVDRNSRTVSRRAIGCLALAGCVLLAAVLWLPGTLAPRPEEAAGQVVSRLATGVTLDRFVGILGRSPDISRPAGPFREAIWVNDVYAVQAVVGDAGVLGYSVTTRSDRFRPPVDVLDSARLGSTPIAEAVGPTWETTLASSGGLTPRGVWWYSEAIPASGASDDRAIVLTASDAGAPAADVPTTGELGLPATPDPNTQVGPFHEFLVDDPQVAFMRGMVPSTYSIIGPELTLDQLPADFRFGPTWDDIHAVR
jgi:hypothetical protein